MATAYIFGDSITAGIAAAPESSRYTNLLAGSELWSFTNYGINGAQILDMVDSMYATIVAQSDNSVALVGYNDMRQGGLDAGVLDTFEGTLYATAAWLGIPNFTKTNSRNLGRVSYAGTWLDNGTTYGGSFSRYSTVVGSTATFETTGTIIYIGCTRISGAAGIINVTIDGIDRGDYSCSGVTDTYAGRTYGPFLIRVTGLADIGHTVVLTFVSGSGSIYFDWFGTPTNNITDDGPNVYIGRCLYMNPTGYTLGIGPNFISGSDAAVVAYNAIIDTVVTELHRDGLRIASAPTDSYYNPNDAGEIDGDNIHPTNLGHLHIANAFIYAVDYGWPIIVPDPGKILFKSNGKFLRGLYKVLRGNE